MKKIIGYENEKKVVAELRDMLENSQTYRQQGVRLPRGLILSGPPGVGKTVLANSLITGSISKISFNTSILCEDDYGDEIIRVFEEAKNHQPCVLLIDELDKIANSSEMFYTETTSNIQKLLLNKLDELNSKDDILVVGICNSVIELGDALLRAGRFDRHLKIPLPDLQTRKEIFKYYIDNIKIQKKIDYETVGKFTNYYSGAKIEALVNDIGIMAIAENRKVITTDDVYEVIKRQNFKARKTDECDEDVKYKTAVHEAGHALLALMLTPENIFNVSIEAQGESLGNTYCFNKSNNLCSLNDKKNEIMIALGGHVAERVVFSDYLIGAESDLKRARESMAFLIQECGMCGYKYITGETFQKSESTNRKISEQLEILDSNVQTIINQNRALFDEIVAKLITQSSLSRDEMFALKKGTENNRSPIHNFDNYDKVDEIYINFKEVKNMRIKLEEEKQINWTKREKYNKPNEYTQKQRNLKKSYKMGYTNDNRKMEKYGLQSIYDYDWAA